MVVGAATAALGIGLLVQGSEQRPTLHEPANGTAQHLPPGEPPDTGAFARPAPSITTLPTPVTPATAPTAEPTPTAPEPDIPELSADIVRANIVDVPRRIDATGATDVSAAMAEFLASVPDNSTIRFQPRGIYRMESTLLIENRFHLTLDGRGATIFATTPGDLKRSHVNIEGGGDIVVRHLMVRGVNPHAGAEADEAYNPEKEGQHGFKVMTSAFVVLEHVVVTDVWGDFVMLGRRYGEPWATGIVIRNSIFLRNGRQGIALVSARNVLIEGNLLHDVRRATIDLEPESIGGGVTDVVVRNNYVGAGRLMFIAGGGYGPIDNVVIENNELRGQAMQVLMNDTSGGRRRNWRFTGNTADLTFNGPHGSLMRFHRIDGLEVRGNRQPFAPGMYAVETTDSCDVRVIGNDFPGAAGGLRQNGTC